MISRNVFCHRADFVPIGVGNVDLGVHRARTLLHVQ